jgi:multisubunit Na+/H+ antiporter MnhF subunit
MKKRMTQSEEFEMMRMVLDKFLWIGSFIMLYALYKIFNGGSFTDNLALLVSGAIVLVLFIVLLVKNFESSNK